MIKAYPVPAEAFCKEQALCVYTKLAEEFSKIRPNLEPRTGGIFLWKTAFFPCILTGERTAQSFYSRFLLDSSFKKRYNFLKTKVFKLRIRGV